MTNQVSKLGKVGGKLLFTISFVVLMFSITFIGAGRIDYWQGWVFNGLNIIFILLSYFLLPPELIQERLKPGEGMKEWDKIFLIVYVPVFFAILIISVLDGGRFTGETLQRELEGYMEYTDEVRYRLLPGIW
jgi:hypothetical protein